MFGSTSPFGQSSNSPFGSQSVFGQTNNPTNNPFAPKPFGSPNPFGSQSGGSIFGGTSTGVFGAPQASTPTFGSSSSPAFGTSTPAFGASTPAFGSGSSSFGGSSLFGQQKPAFGGFGSTPSQSSPFGSTFQQPQTQAAFGSNLFGSSTPFGGASQPAFGASSSPAFGATSSPAFGATTTPAFGAASTPAFGSTTTPAFGSTGSAFGVSSAPAFGSGGTFGASSNPAFGASSTSAFGTSSTPAFGSSATPAFGAPTTPSFSFGSSPAFGQSTSVFGSSPFGSTPSPSPFGAQSSAFGSQTTTPTFGTTTFGQSSFGGQQRGGSRVAAYTPTAEQDGATGTQAAGKLESISAMPVYKDKSHEELRWEDYQLGDKGGPNPAGQSAAAGSGIGTSAPSNPFGTSFNQSSPNPFSSTTASNPFAAKTPAFNNPSSTSSFSSSPFGASSAANPFGTTNPSPAPFGAAANPFGGTSTSTSIFGAPNTSSAFQSSPSPFGTSSASGTTSTFGGNTQTAGLFQTTSTLTQQNSTGGFGQTTSPFGQNATPSFTQANLFSTPSTNFGGNLFNSTPAANNSIFGQTTSTQPTQTGGSLFGNFGQTQQTPAPTGGFGGGSSLFGQGAFGQSTANQSGAVAVQPAPVATNPFGTLPAMPQISIARAGSSPSIQYGISNMPVADKPAPVRVSSLLTSRHLSQRRIRLPARKYHPKKDGSRVPFFSDDEEAASTPKADALFIPRENPRALVIRPTEQWASRSVVEKSVLPRDTNTSVHENGKISGKEIGPGLNGSNDQQKDKNNPAENGNDKERVGPTKHNQKANGIHEDHSAQKGDSYITLTGHRAGEAAIVYEHGADIEALMPKLRHSDYYTEPRVQELAAKERAEPGFCRRVKDFVVGRHGFGSIKFMGETDVRRLDLEGLVQFNNREVIVYMDEGKKPPVGQGLNKPAEVTLLNIKCFDKKTGTQYTEGPKIEKYKEMLMKKARDQGAEFVSYDPLKGEWKFKVNHFSCYKLDDEEAAADLMGLGVSLVADN